jgi:hypothetical protein
MARGAWGGLREMGSESRTAWSDRTRFLHLGQWWDRLEADRIMILIWTSGPQAWCRSPRSDMSIRLWCHRLPGSCSVLRVPPPAHLILYRLIRIKTIRLARPAFRRPARPGMRFVGETAGAAARGRETRGDSRNPRRSTRQATSARPDSPPVTLRVHRHSGGQSGTFLDLAVGGCVHVLN